MSKSIFADKSRCEHACRPPYQGHNRPCVNCAKQHDLDMEQAFREHVLEQEAMRVDDAKPATDAEWLVWLDTQAPREVAPDVQDMPCPLCCGRGYIGVRFQGDDQLLQCMWCGGIGIVPDLPGWDHPHFDVGNGNVATTMLRPA